MSEDDPNRDSFEEMIRSIAREVSQSIERISEVDLDEIAGTIGVDPARAREWVDTAVGWVREQAENLGEDMAHWGAAQEHAPAKEEQLGSAGPRPLDLPTAEQGMALAALDSGRWTVEPGSHELVAQDDGPGPDDALGLVGELRARDWIAADGEITLVGRHALGRWLEAEKSS